MKHTMIFILVFTWSQALTGQCEDATTAATKIHWDYVNGDNNVTITDSYNAAAKMDKVCKNG